MSIEERPMGKALVLKVQHVRIDAAVAKDFKTQLTKIIDSKVGQSFILDISSTNFIDSSGLGAIVSTLKHLGASGNVSIAGAQNNVQTLFKMTRMDKVFTMYKTPAEAIAAIG